MKVLDFIKTFAISGVLLFIGCSDNGNGNGGDGKGDDDKSVNYTITFDSRGGTNVNSITRTSGTSVSLPSTSRGGYTFNGWYSSSSGGSRYGGGGDNYTIIGNVTMYAQWTQGNVVVGGETKTVQGIECILVEGGTFLMGEIDPSYVWWSGPATQQVTLTQDYYIGKYEVTNAQYAEFLNEKRIGEEGEYNGNTLIYESNYWGDEFSFGLNYINGSWQPVSGYANHPVVNVTWYGADEFARSKGGRLPTEAEWEFAARGGNKSKGYIYSGSNNLDEVGWYYENSGDKILNEEEWDYDILIENNNRTHPVGQKKANELGIYDMSGNVWEWCNDWYSAYSASGVVNPTGPSTGDYRVLRGGYWDDYALICGVAYRGNLYPSKNSIDIGFRVVFPRD